MTKTDNHLADDTECQARWGRSSDYRNNALKGIRAKPARLLVYDNEVILSLTLAGVSPKPESSGGRSIPISAGSPAHIARYKLAAFINGRKPYPNHAHHMIPANAFINRFPEKQKKILHQIKYDVNNPNNLILLPANSAATRYHLLPWHQTDNFHAPYSNEVKRAATKVEKKIKKAADSDNPCEKQDIPKDIAKDLEVYENLLWNVIVNLGPKSINEIRIPDEKNWGELI